MHKRTQGEPCLEGQSILLEVLWPELVTLPLFEHSKLEIDVCD
jgi:hypothetical protein